MLDLDPLALDRVELVGADRIERRQERPLGRVQLRQRLGVGEPHRPQLDLLYHRRDARPLSVQGLRRPRHRARRARRRRSVPARSRLRGRVRAGHDGDRPRHAPDLAGAGRGGRPRRLRAGRRRRRAGPRSAPRCSTSPSASTATRAASRSPPRTTRAQYNGMKIVRRGALPVGGDTGLDKIKRFAGQGDCPTAPTQRGTIAQRDVYEGFAERVLRFIDPAAIAAAAGRAGRQQRHGRPDDRAAPRSACRSTPIPYHLDPDGSFPNHEPNPLLEENRQFIIERGASRSGADLGIAWDGDADRCFFIDDTGEFVPGDLITALIADRCWNATPARRSSTTCAPRWAVRDTVARGGRHGAREPRRPRLHQGPHAQGGRASSPARCRATTTSATSTTATPASCRRWCCWS